MNSFLHSRKRPREGYLAIQVAGGFVSHVELTWQSGRAKVVSCMHRSEENDSERLWKDYTNTSVPVGIVLSVGEYQLLPLDAPPVPPEELKMAVRWQIRDQIEYPLEDVTVDVIRLDQGAKDANGKLLAIVANNKVLKRYVGLAERVKLSLAAIDIPELAQRNISAMLESPGQALAMLSFTVQGGLLTVTRNGDLCFYRRLECNAAEVFGMDANRRTAYFDRIALELQRSLDHIERQYRDWQIAKIALPLPPAIPGLTEHLRRQVYIPLETVALDLFFDGDVSSLNERLSACWFAFGGALRRLEQSP